MRNARLIADQFIVTTDNSGAIGEKEQDVVAVADDITAYYAARVALLEQWAAGGDPLIVLIHNFSGEDSWPRYQAGVERLLKEAGYSDLPIQGSSETNMTLLQSALAVTMIGKKQSAAPVYEGDWFTYGSPYVGDDVMTYSEEIAALPKIKEGLERKIVSRMWPVGSKGIRHEAQVLWQNTSLTLDTPLAVDQSAGPATVVLLQIPHDYQEAARVLFGPQLRPFTYYS